MKKLGLTAFFIGIIIIVFYSLSSIFISSEISLWVKIAFTLILTGMILIIVNHYKDRKKDKEEEDDFSQY
ncbi:MAG: hypothetical protein KAH05_01365 [Clostridiales bacterium]|nr:hypothetical protein [Clostridiales bacterium]